MEIGQILRELLDLHEISQKTLADKLHISPSTLGNYIRDNREPGFETLKAIARYFDISVDYLLDFQQKQTVDHSEDHLLQIYRSLSPEKKELLIDQGCLLLKHDKK